MIDFDISTGMLFQTIGELFVQRLLLENQNVAQDKDIERLSRLLSDRDKGD